MLPMLLAVLAFAAVSLLVVRSTFQGNGDASRWAAISTIWLVLPVMLGGLIVLVLIVAMIYLLGMATNLIPPYSYRAQRITARIESSVKRLSAMVRRPALFVRELGQLVRSGITRARERM